MGAQAAVSLHGFDGKAVTKSFGWLAAAIVFATLSAAALVAPSTRAPRRPPPPPAREAGPCSEACCCGCKRGGPCECANHPVRCGPEGEL